jgi:TolA-binding protein
MMPFTLPQPVAAARRRTALWMVLLLAGMAVVPPTAWAQEEPGDAVEAPVSEEGADDGAEPVEDGELIPEQSPGIAPTGGLGLPPMRDESAGVRSAIGLGRPFPRPEGASEGLLDDLDAFEGALGTFEREIEAYRQSISQVVRSEYRRRQQAIQSYYDTRIREARVLEGERRTVAIADFERFLERYPNTPEYTPDVMFRLAELHYEASLDRYLREDDEYFALQRRYDAGVLAELPEAPRYDFSRTIELFEDLMARFPDYRQIDGVYYLTGIAWDQMFEEDRALELFHVLVDRFPESRFAQETWFRIGEFRFNYYEFDESRDAYERALAYGHSQLYDKVLFKLGWSEYLLGRYGVAAGHFQTVLDYYEFGPDGPDGEGTTPAPRNRGVQEESLRYFAICLAEDDWDEDYQEDPDYLIPRLERVLLAQEREYNLPVLDFLFEVLGQANRHALAVQVARLTLERWPLDRQNPQRHNMLIAAMLQAGDAPGALAELEVIAQAYAPDSAWYREQERLGNHAALAYADQLARSSLLDSANNAYQEADALATQAEQTQDPILAQEARNRFRMAAALYAAFLDQYPDAEESYETRVVLAQALLSGGLYAEAAEQYEAVRDSGESEEYRVLAATQAVFAWEAALQEEIDAGRLEPRAWPGYEGPMLATADDALEDEEEEERAGPRPAPGEEPIPALSLRWVAANDVFIAMGLVDEEDPNRDVVSAFRSGVLLYRYHHYEAARQRFIAVMDACKPIDETGYAAAFLIESYAMTNDLESLQFWSAELERRSACVPESLREALAQDVDRMAMGQLAERADALYAEGRFREAAEEYMRLADEWADNPDTASRALYNAGLMYEQNLNRYADAMTVFDRIVQQYGHTEFLDDALVRIAVNSRKFFDFERAIATYRELHAMSYSEPGVLDYPLLNAAELLLQSGRHDEAAQAFLDHVRTFPNDGRNPEWVYRAALAREQSGDTRGMMTTFEQFRRDYSNARSPEGFNIDAAIVDSWNRQMKAYQASGDTRNAQRAREQVVREYQLRQPQSPAAQGAVAQIRYEDAMVRFDAWEAIRPRGDLNARVRTVQSQEQQIPELALAFEEVRDYNVLDWTVCAMYMQGRLLSSYAEMVRPLTEPYDGMSPDEFYDTFGDLIMQIEDNMLRPAEDRAVELWRVAYEVMQQTSLVNSCTIDTIRQLNRIDPEGVPLFKQDLQHTESQVVAPQYFAIPPAPSVDDAVEDPVAEDAP